MEASTDKTRSGAERILDAAIDLFGERGFRATPLKAIADQANVSQALIVHHYGSKDGLRAACDEHVAHLVRVRKEETVDDVGQFDPFLALHRLQEGRPLLRYLTRALTEGGRHASELIDEMIVDAEDYLAQGERAGLIKTSAVPRDRAAMLVIWSLGALTLHEHVHRLFGADFLAASTPPEDLQRYLRPAVELYTQGLVREGSFDRLEAALSTPAADAGEATVAEPPDESDTGSERDDEKEQ